MPRTTVHLFYRTKTQIYFKLIFTLAEVKYLKALLFFDFAFFLISQKSFSIKRENRYTAIAAKNVPTFFALFI
jgi:hypothetical protein